MRRARASSLPFVLAVLVVLAPPSLAPANDAPLAATPPTPVEWLLAQQRDDGAFGEVAAHRFQTTAFVIIALSDARVVPRTESVRRALARAVDHLDSYQADTGAFVDGGVDRTVLGLLALVSYRDGASRDTDVRSNLRTAVALLPPELLGAIEVAPPSHAPPDERALVHAAYALGDAR